MLAKVAAEAVDSEEHMVLSVPKPTKLYLGARVDDPTSVRILYSLGAAKIYCFIGKLESPLRVARTRCKQI
jgi:hypothetical protein